MFELGPVPQEALTYNGMRAFNPLPGVGVPVPRTDADGWPIGGVRYPEVDHPLGRPAPPAIPHVGTDSIGDICGNFGGFTPFAMNELLARYGSNEAYLDAYAESLDVLIVDGFILSSDRAGMLAHAADLFGDAP